MRSRRILVLLCAAPLALTWLGCSSRTLHLSRAAPPASVDTSSYSFRLLQLARRYEQQGNREGALRLYRQIAAADPQHTEARKRIAAIMGEVSRPADPEPKQAIPGDPEPQRAIAAETPRHAAPERERNAQEVTEIPRPSIMESPLVAEVIEGSPDDLTPRAMPATADSTNWTSSPQVEEDPAFTEWVQSRESTVATEPTEPTVATATEAIESETADVSEDWWEKEATPPTAESKAPDTSDVPEWAQQDADPTPAETPTSLVSLCPDADEELRSIVGHLEEEDEVVRKEALMYLSNLGGDATGALPAVKVLLHDPDDLVRAHAAWTIWSIEDHEGQAVSELASLTESDSEDAVQLAAFFLGCIGPDARDAESALRRARDAATGTTRLHLAEALVRINPEDLVSLNELTRGLQSEDPALRWLSAVALTGISPEHAPWIVPALSARLSDSEPSVCSAAALTLGSLGPAAQLAIAPLRKAATHQEPDVRLAAETALACIQQ